ncbi:MAG: hypothetical protein HFE78_07655 [Clostridiales bacterium]|nr:hypothetical protein [Clostridiales bacterium]
MKHATRSVSIIYHLTEEQSLAIHRAGVLLVKDESNINIYDMQFPQDIAEHIVNYFNRNANDGIFICSGQKNPECVEFDNLLLQENTKLYIFFKIVCERDTEVIISAKTDFVTRTWINSRFVISHPTPLITKLNAGENLFIIELTRPNVGAYVHYRVNTLANECEKQPLSYMSSNLQKLTGRFWWMNKWYDKNTVYAKEKIEYILLPLDEVNVDITQKLEARIYLYDPPILLDSFDNYFYQTHIIDLSKYDYAISESPNHLIFQITCQTKDGKISMIERKFFLYPVIDDPSYWVNTAQRLMDSGELSPAEYNCLGFYIQAIVQPDYGLLEGQDLSISMLADAIKAVESGKYMQELYMPGHKYLYIHSSLDDRYIRAGIHLPSEYSREKKYPLLLLMMTGSWLNFEQSSVMNNYHKEAVISVDISGRGVTLGSYVGETSSLEIISEVKKFFPIDEERIYMIGYSSGGFASFALAQAMPGEFAGICSAGGNLYLPNLENLYHTKVINIISKDDSAYHKNAFQTLSKLCDYTELIGDKTVHSDLEKLYLNEAVIEQLLSARLERYPNQVFFRTERNRHLKAYWLRLHAIESDKTYAEIKAEIVDNHIQIICENLAGFTVEIPPHIDRSHFKITINNEKTFEFHHFAGNEIHFVKDACGYSQSEIPVQCEHTYKGNGLLDVYLDPLRILCGDGNNEHLLKTASVFSEPTTNGFDAQVHVKYPIITLDNINNAVLCEHSLVVIDCNIEDDILSKIRENCAVSTDKDGYVFDEARYNGSYCVMQIVQNPWNSKYHILYINTNDSKLLSKNLFTRRMILPAYVNGRHPYLNQDILIFNEKGYSVY